MWHENRIKEYIKVNLTKERYNHSIGVMNTCEELAKHYGVDADKARLAGLCHDCAKNFSGGDLINKAKANGAIIDSVCYKSPHLLHGVVGAYITKELFKINDEEILSAIKYHTTGKEDMTVLEKIVYLADCIEPGRTYKGVDEIRKLAYQNLDKALLKSFDSTITDVIARGAIVHVDTVKARNYLLMNRNFNY